MQKTQLTRTRKGKYLVVNTPDFSKKEMQLCQPARSQPKEKQS